jgi:hypothetical protein
MRLPASASANQSEKKSLANVHGNVDPPTIFDALAFGTVGLLLLPPAIPTASSALAFSTAATCKAQ